MFDSKKYHYEYGKKYYQANKHKQKPVITCPDCGEKKDRYRGGRCKSCYFKRALARRAEKRGIGICPGCGIEFQRRVTIQKYCSQKCWDKKTYEMSSHHKRADVSCKNCHTIFMQKDYRQKFCSSKCSESYKFAQKKEPQTPAKKLSAVCQKCSKCFTVLSRYYKKKIFTRDPKFCSLKCAYEARRGKASPLYRGPANGTRGASWKELASEVRARDNQVCQICHKSQTRKLPVDHIIPERLLVRWGIECHHRSNLVTLCTSCHGKKTQSEYRLLKGDMVGFISELKAMNYPEWAIISAFKYAGLRL